jgi:hypothetical protein
MKISVFKNLFKSKDVPYSMDLDKVIARIRVGKSKEIVDRVRAGDKNAKNELPCILFAGEFTERNSNSLVKHSGLMVVDFDKYPTEEEMNEHLEELKQNPHFVVLFISPSGKGIKGVVKIPESDKHTHVKYFKAFKQMFFKENKYFDNANSNVDRVCYESYDPNIYVNKEAELFDAELIDEGFKTSEKVPLLPINDESSIIDRIMKFNWKRGFNDGERNAFIFDLAGAFCEYGISEYTAEGYILNNIVIGDFPESEAITAIRSAYRKRTANSKFFEDYTKLDRIKSDLKMGKKAVVEKYSISEGTYDEIKEESDHSVFWSIDEKGKVLINSLKYKTFLERNGFKKYYPADTQHSNLVYVFENRVIETSKERIKDFVLDYLMTRGEIEVWNYCVKYHNLFSEEFLIMLDTIELMMLKDTRDKSFIAYKNGVLVVSKDTAELVEYIEVGGYVWERQIINRDFIKLDTDENDYKHFINNVSNKEPLSLESVTGYLLSNYKNKSKNRAIILNDETISDNPEGGTGKGVWVQGVAQIRNTAVLDGKTLKDEKFDYQTVSTETQILVFDDVVRNFNFESKFSLVTEGITLERKNKDAIKLSVEDSPRMVISTNYAIKGEGNSHDRRRFEVEFAQYYGKNLTPADEFGRQLFDDWDEEEFSRFDNYMVYCLQTYLKLGLVPQNAKNIKLRKFIAETSMEFKEWIDDRDNVALDCRLDKQVYYDRFTNEYQDFKKWLTRKKFNIWMQKYCTFMNYEYVDGISNGSRWFILNTKQGVLIDEDDF